LPDTRCKRNTQILELTEQKRLLTDCQKRKQHLLLGSIQRKYYCLTAIKTILQLLKSTVHFKFTVFFLKLDIFYGFLYCLKKAFLPNISQ